MNRVITYYMPESEQERAPEQRALEKSLEGALRAIFIEGDKRDTVKDERQRVRAILSQEITHNVKHLTEIYDLVQ